MRASRARSSQLYDVFGLYSGIWISAYLRLGSPLTFPYGLLPLPRRQERKKQPV